MVVDEVSSVKILPENDSDFVSLLMLMIDDRRWLLSELFEPDSLRCFFFKRIRRRLSELRLSELRIEPLWLLALVFNLCNADSLIEWLARPWLAICSVERVVALRCVNCDRHDTDQGRSELRRFVRGITFGDGHANVLSRSEAAPFCDSKSAEPLIISVDVHWDVLPPPGRQVATESARPSEQSESRAAESDSAIDGNVENEKLAKCSIESTEWVWRAYLLYIHMMHHNRYWMYRLAAKASRRDDFPTIVPPVCSWTNPLIYWYAARWFGVKLHRNQSVPVLWPDSRPQLPADGFPLDTAAARIHRSHKFETKKMYWINRRWNKWQQN